MNLQSLLTNPVVWLAVAAAVFFFFGDKLTAWWNKAPAPVGPTPATDDDSADLAAVRRVQARMKKRNCPEGIAAAGVILSHFFHGEE